MIVKDVTDKLIINHDARKWCVLPYPDHPKGCPNFGKKAICPPKVEYIEDWIKDAIELKIVCVSFDLKEHSDRMMSLHPNWSARQARCLLYWQPKVNKALIAAAEEMANGYKVTYCPEAMGMDVIKTAQSVGIPIVAPPVDTVHKIALLAKLPGEAVNAYQMKFGE